MLDTCIYLWIHPRVQLGLYSCKIHKKRGVKHHLNTRDFHSLQRFAASPCLEQHPAVWVLQPVTRAEGWLMADHPIPVSHGVVVKDLAKRIVISKKLWLEVCVFTAKI